MTCPFPVSAPLFPPDGMRRENSRKTKVPVASEGTMETPRLLPHAKALGWGDREGVCSGARGQHLGRLLGEPSQRPTWPVFTSQFLGPLSTGLGISRANASPVPATLLMTALKREQRVAGHPSTTPLPHCSHSPASVELLPGLSGVIPSFVIPSEHPGAGLSHGLDDGVVWGTLTSNGHSALKGEVEDRDNQDPTCRRRVSERSRGITGPSLAGGWPQKIVNPILCTSYPSVSRKEGQDKREGCSVPGLRLWGKGQCPTASCSPRWLWNLEVRKAWALTINSWEYRKPPY